MKIQDLTVGQSDSIQKVISAADVEAFAGLSADVNPVHLDADYAAGTLFKQRIAHGFLVGSLISAVIGTKLPGEGSIYLDQTMKFLKPVYLGETVRATVTVLSTVPEKGIVKLTTVCEKEQGAEWVPVITGEATIKLLA
jgi:3-hydroxybutyryl-CoA dehydratase